MDEVNSFRILSTAEQVAWQLKEQIANGQLQGALPGVARFSKSLGVNAKTLVSALEILEKEGVVVNQGPRRKRLVDSSKIKPNKQGQIRLCILLYEPSDRRSVNLMEIQHALTDWGHLVSYAEKSLFELKMKLPLVKEMVAQKDFDAWIVVSGSFEILEWFSQQKTPAFALFGRRHNIPIPSIGPKLDVALTEGVNCLIEQGHQRIVKICRIERRKPTPGQLERKFLKVLTHANIPTGDYNLPDWEETAEGLQELLKSLFQVTPPTALIVDEASMLFGILQFLGEHGLQSPRDVSLLCIERDPKFDWCQTSVACLDWDIAMAIRRIVKWTENVGNGISDLRRSSTPAKFVNGGTIGPALALSERE